MTRTSALRARSRRGVPAWWPLPVAVVVAVLTWPVASVTPMNGLDPSWKIALGMAAEHRLDFAHIAFTYGPLGFLEAPVNAEPHTLVPALAWTLALQVGLAWSVIECSRRTLGPLVAIALAFLSCQLLGEGREVLPLVAFLCAALVVQWGVPSRPARVAPALWGLAAAAGLLIKLNEGVVVLALGLVAAWWLGPSRLRSYAVLVGTTLVGVVVLWLAFGGSLSGLPGWTRDSVRLASGYSAGLPVEMPLRSWDYPLFIVVVATIAWFGWLAGAGLPRSRRIGMGIAGAVLVASLFKHGFVRHDLGHAASTFTALIAAAAAVRWTPTPLGRLAGAGVCAVALAGTLVVLGRGATDSTWTLLDPWPRLQAAGDQARLVVDPGRRARERREAAATLRATYALPPAVIDRLRGHTVHVDPYETAVVWAYGLDWRPIPVFQDYAVYTNALDRENAAALLGPDAPERILRHGGPRIDGHTPESEGPEGLKAMICGYRQAVWAGGWQVLERAPDRCGPERSLGTVTARVGDAVPIPPAPSPRDMVMARIHMPVPLLARLRTALYKPRRMPSVALDDRYGFLIPASLAAGPLLMRAPASIGWHDYAPGYSFDRLRVAGPASPVTIDFLAVRVEPSRPAAASGTSPSRHVSATRKVGRARTSS